MNQVIVESKAMDSEIHLQSILIIDDDTQLTELLDEFLGSYKYDIIIKHTPEEGLESDMDSQMCAEDD